MICPQCGSSSDMRTTLRETRDDSTGYHEESVAYVCMACGEISTEEEMEAANAD